MFYCEYTISFTQLRMMNNFYNILRAQVCNLHIFPRQDMLCVINLVKHILRKLDVLGKQTIRLIRLYKGKSLEKERKSSILLFILFCGHDVLQKITGIFSKYRFSEVSKNGKEGKVQEGQHYAIY